MKSCFAFRLNYRIVRLKVALQLTALFIITVGVTVGQTTITLKNSFIEKYKNKATISATYTIDKAHAKPNPAKMQAPSVS